MRLIITIFLLASVLAFVWGAQQGQVYTTTTFLSPTSSSDDSSGAAMLHATPSIVSMGVALLWFLV